MKKKYFILERSNAKVKNKNKYVKSKQSIKFVIKTHIIATKRIHVKLPNFWKQIVWLPTFEWASVFVRSIDFFSNKQTESLRCLLPPLHTIWTLSRTAKDHTMGISKDKGHWSYCISRCNSLTQSHWRIHIVNILKQTTKCWNAHEAKQIETRVK